jgi:hypothetical protein
MEKFIYAFDEWSIDRAKQIIKDRPRPIRTLNIEPFEEFIGRPGKIRFFGVVVNWRKAESDKVDLDVPVITAYGSMGKIPIDGWHRIAKALLKGLKELPWLALTKEESKKVHTYNGPVRKKRRRAPRRRR